MKGCYHPIGRPQGVLIVAVAFNSGNLLPVAVALRAKYPELALVVAADDDHRTEGNSGITAATAAALAVGGFVVKPLFPADRPPKATDFNDLAALAGLGAVRARFAPCWRTCHADRDP